MTSFSQKQSRQRKSDKLPIKFDDKMNSPQNVEKLLQSEKTNMEVRKAFLSRYEGKETGKIKV